MTDVRAGVTVVRTVAIVGIDARAVRLECTVAPGLPVLRLVGLPDVAVREAAERVRAAIVRSGLRWPAARIVANLAPADLPKAGSGFDLPLALAVLAASGQLDGRRLATVWAHGELGLDGRLRAVPGGLAVAVGAQRFGAPALLVPSEGSAPLAAVAGLTAWPAVDLAEAVALVSGRERPRPLAPAPTPMAVPVPDLADVRGQPVARRAVEVAAAGDHHLLLVGPPGCGKTMLARRLPGLLPDLAPAAALEVAAIHALAGVPPPEPRGRPPVRAPHVVTSPAALIGGGTGIVRPGEVSLAHHGVLILDELLETPRSVLDALRQPLEEGRVVVARVGTRVVLPARVQLVAATNPCPCGHLGHPSRPCTCRPDRVERYRARLSGPLVDRIDVHVALGPLASTDLTSVPTGEATAAVARRVALAREVARARWRDATNRSVDDARVRATVRPRALTTLARGVDALRLSARSFDRALRVARTIADLGGAGAVEVEHVEESLALRGVRP